MITFVFFTDICFSVIWYLLGNAKVLHPALESLIVHLVEYVDENTILGQSENAGQAYVELIMPD